MLQPFTAISLKLLIHISDTLGQFLRFIRSPAGNKGIRHITGLPISEPLDIIDDTETADSQIIKSGEKQLPEQLGKLQAKDDAGIEAVNHFIQEPEKFPVLYLAPVLLLEQSVVNILKIMVDVQGHAVEGLVLGMRIDIPLHHLIEIVSPFTLGSGWRTPIESLP